MWRLLPLVLLGLLIGCDRPIESFPPNQLFSLTLARSRSLPVADATVDATAVTEDLFGTPNTPRWPEQLGPLVSIERVAQAAGPVSSEKDGTNRGLYRKHCVKCHGLDGSGAGPASLYQNPHPRDFRHGIFKWKSTRRSAKPTRDDLQEILAQGAPGTAMPAFAAIDHPPIPTAADTDLQAL